MCQSEILAHLSVNISPFCLDQYCIYNMLLSINLLFSLCFPPSLCMIDWLTDSVFLYSCVLLLDWNIDGPLTLLARLSYCIFLPIFHLSYQDYRKTDIYNQTLTLSCLKRPHGGFKWILSKCTGYHWWHRYSSTEKQGMWVTYKVTAVNKSTCGEDGLVCGEGLHRAVGGGAARASRRPEENLCLARLYAYTHTQAKAQWWETALFNTSSLVAYSH